MTYKQKKAVLDRYVRDAMNQALRSPKGHGASLLYYLKLYHHYVKNSSNEDLFFALEGIFIISLNFFIF